MGLHRFSMTAAACAALILSTGCARTPLGAGVPAEAGFGDAGPPPPPDCRLWPLSPNFDAAGLVPFAGGVAVVGTECREGGCEAVVLVATGADAVRRVEFDDSRYPRSVAFRRDGAALVLFNDRRVEQMVIDASGVRSRRPLVRVGDGNSDLLANGSVAALAVGDAGRFVAAGYVPGHPFAPAVWSFEADGRQRWNWAETLDTSAYLEGVLPLAGGAVVAWGWAERPRAPDALPETDPVLVVLDKRVAVGRDEVGLGMFTGGVLLPGGALLLGLTTDFYEGRAVTLPVDSAGEVGAAVPLPEPSAGARALYVGGQPNGGGLVLVGGDYAEYEREVAVVVGIGGDGQVAWSRRFPDRVRSMATFVAPTPEGPLAVLVEGTESCCYDVVAERAVSLAWLNPDGTCAD